MPANTHQKLVASDPSTDLLSELVVPTGNHPGALTSIAAAHRAADALAKLPKELQTVIDAKYLGASGTSDSEVAARLGLAPEEFRDLHEAALRQLMLGASK